MKSKKGLPRQALIRLASTLPEGSKDRKVILAAINWFPETIERSKREGKTLVQDPKTKDRVYAILDAKTYLDDLSQDPALRGDRDLASFRREFARLMERFRQVMDSRYIWD